MAEWTTDEDGLAEISPADSLKVGLINLRIPRSEEYEEALDRRAAVHKIDIKTDLNVGRPMLIVPKNE